MHTFLSQHIYLQDFVAALAMLGLGLEGYSADPELSASDEFTLRRTP
ncbi:MAG: hypothetical protein ABL915_10900 [Gallionella sp.]